MVINTNITAQKTAFNFNVSQTQLSQSLSRLSSGSKIIKPSDDAGGLAVTSRTQSIIKRLNAALNDVANANSYSQTQDGYLKNVDKAFRRMGELAVLAKDETKTIEDRSLYNMEFKKLQEYVANVAIQEFNGISLFDGKKLEVVQDESGNMFSMDGVKLIGEPYSNAINSGTNSWTLNQPAWETSEPGFITNEPLWKLDNGQYSKTDPGNGTTVIPTGTLILTPPVYPESVNNKTDIVFVIDVSGSMSSPIGKVKSNITDLVNDLEARGLDVNIGGIRYSDSLAGGGGGDTPPDGDGMYTDANSFLTNWLNPLRLQGGGDLPEDGLGGLTTALQGGEFASSPYRSEAKKTFILVTDISVKDTEDGDTGAVQSLNGVIGELKAADVTVHTISNGHTDVKEISTQTGGSDYNIGATSYEGIFDNLVNEIESDVNGLAGADSFTSIPTGYYFTRDITASGEDPNAENVAAGSLVTTSQDLGATGLNIATENSADYQDVNLNSTAGATIAHSLIQTAINQLAADRSVLGAGMSRLEFTKDQLVVLKDNMSHAVSRIKDVNFAEESTNYARSQILVQTGANLLNEANLVPKVMLNLLK